jgi:hypothetical protein
MSAKYTVSEVRQRIETPLADARGSDRSRDREGAESLEYATVFLKPRTKLRSPDLTPVVFAGGEIGMILELFADWAALG